MENKLIMPAECLVMNEEEMTYTEGGWFVIDDIAAFIFGMEVGQYAKKHPDAGFANVLDRGLAPAKSRWGSVLTTIVCVINPAASIFGIVTGLLI